MSEPRVVERRPIVAYTLDLFDAPPKPVRAWRPVIYGWRWGGMLALPITSDTRRQWRMLRPDTLVEVEQ